MRNAVRLSALWFVFITAATGLRGAADDKNVANDATDPRLPRPVAADRYRALAARSPFSPPTAEAPPPVVAPVPPPPGWGEKYVLGGLGQFGAGYRVTLSPKNPVGAGAASSAGGANASAAERLVIFTDQPNAEGITLGGVQWGDDPRQTRVTLLKGGVPAVFNFDANALSTANARSATAPPTPISPRLPNAPGVTQQTPLPGATPTPGIVRSPVTRAPIRPPPSSSPTGAPAPNGGAVPFTPPAPPPAAPVRVAPLPGTPVVAPNAAIARPPQPGNAATEDEED